MSDGPHKSLPLRRAWKRVCAIAGNTTHGLDEVVERLLPALAADVRHEVGEAFAAKLRKILEPDAEQLTLFSDVRDQLAALRREQCSPFQSDLIDSVDDAVRDGRKGLDALTTGAKVAIDTRASATINSVVEHYLRKAPHEAAVGGRSSTLRWLKGGRCSGGRSRQRVGNWTACCSSLTARASVRSG